MSRASEIRKRLQTAELVLPDGSRFIARRPSFREVAETGLVLLPDETPAPPEPTAAVEDNAPTAVKVAQAHKGFLIFDKVQRFMVATSLDPLIVPPATPITDPDKYVHEGEVAGKEMWFLFASMREFFGIEVAATASFPGGSGPEAAPDGEALRVQAECVS